MVSILGFYRQGAGPRGLVGTLSQYMLNSAATLGFFLGIGSVSIEYFYDVLSNKLMTSGI